MTTAARKTTTRSRRARTIHPPEPEAEVIELGDLVFGVGIDEQWYEGEVTDLGIKYFVLNHDKKQAILKGSAELRKKGTGKVSDPTPDSPFAAAYEAEAQVQPIVYVHQVSLDSFGSLNSVEALTRDKAKGLINWDNREWVVTASSHRDRTLYVEAIAVVPIAEWRDTTYTYRELTQRAGAFDRTGQAIFHKNRILVLTGEQIRFEPREDSPQNPPGENRMERWRRRQAEKRAIAPATPTEIIPTDTAARLLQLEGDIDEGLALIEQGKARIWQAVSAIQQEDLWRLPDPSRGRPDGYNSFEDYGKTRWGWERSNTFEVAAAGEVIGQLRQSGVPDSQLPTSVSQVRELKRLPPEQRSTALLKAHEATDGKPTAAAIRAAAQPEPVVTERDLVQSLQVAVEKHNDRAAHYGAGVTPETAEALSSMGITACKPSITPEEFNREMQTAGLLPAARSPESSAAVNHCPAPDYFAPPGCLKTRSVEGGQEIFGLILSDERMTKLAKLAGKLDWRKRRLADAIFYLIDSYQMEE